MSYNRVPARVFAASYTPYLPTVYNGGYYAQPIYPAYILTEQDYASLENARAIVTPVQTVAPAGTTIINNITQAETRLISPNNVDFTAQIASAQILQSVALPLKRTYLAIQNSPDSTESLLLGFGGPGNYQIGPGETWFPAGNVVPQNAVWIARTNAAAGVATGTILTEVLYT